MELRAHFNKLEQQKTDLLLKVRGLSPQRLICRPSPNEWSVIEMVDHLVRVEVGILATAKKGLSDPHRIGIKDKLRTRFIQSVFSSDRKVKVPASASQVLPGPNLDFNEILERWDEGRGQLAVFLERFPLEKINLGIFRHPVGGWMGLPQILDFFSVHLIHHHHQLGRIQAALNHLPEGADDCSRSALQN